MRFLGTQLNENTAVLAFNCDVVVASPMDKFKKLLKCGRKLVLREAKRGRNVGGKFYGCAGFPKCRYTRDLNQK